MRNLRKVMQRDGMEREVPAKSLKWHYLISKYLKPVIEANEPQGTINAHTNNLAALYEQSCRDESLMVCATYLPPKVTTVLVQDQNSPATQVMFTEILPKKFKKQPRKSVRKVQEVRKFNKNNSVFKDFKEEN